MLWAWLPRKSGGAIQGRIQEFQNWGLRPTIRKARGEGEGVLYASGPPIRKAGGGGGVAVRFMQARCEKWGGGRLLSEEGEVPYMKGVLQPPTLPTGKKRVESYWNHCVILQRITHKSHASDFLCKITQ